MRVKLPMGIESFEEIRTQGFYYVDKSLLIRDLLSGWGKVNLFTRPRRFGKTLLMSMLRSFFEIGSDRTLFDGLAISEEKQLCDAYMGQFPVVFVSLKGAEALSFDMATDRMFEIVFDEAARHQYLLESEKLSEYDKEVLVTLLRKENAATNLPGALKTLSRLLEKHYDKKVILLIDEYDVPLNKAHECGYYNEMLDLIRSMFNAALKTNESLYFAVMTGCLRVSRESVFTGLNNLIVHSISDTRFDEFFGFTDDEVMKMLRYYELEAHGETMKEWYDGYRFGDQAVYCPWDVINYCYDLLASDAAEPQAYWLNTSGNGLVRTLIERAEKRTAKNDIETLISGGSIRKRVNEQLTYGEIDRNIDDVWSILYMTGYLTLKSKLADGVYELIIPNREIELIYIAQIRKWFDEQVRTETDKLSDLFMAFETGNTDAIERNLTARLRDTISYYDARESFYHGFLLSLLSTCEDWDVLSNIETGLGRGDIIIQRNDGMRGMVIEVKHVKLEESLESACDEAMEQIESKAYGAVFERNDVSDIWMYGIAFYMKKCRVIAKHVTL